MDEITFRRQILIPIILFWVLCPRESFSQQSISASYNYGTIVIHSPEIEPLINGPVHGFTLNYALPNKRGEDWRPFYNNPNYGFSYNYKNYGSPDILGNSHSFTTFLQLSFLKNHHFFDIGFKGFAGIGYFTKIYDPENNPLNKAISAHMNISAETRMYTKIRIKPYFLEYSLGLNHFSNGLIKAPNLGINVLNNSFTLGVELEDQSHESKPLKSERPPLIKNEFWAMASIGLKEIEFNEKRYIFSSVSINYSKQVSSINKLGIGMDFLNDPSLTPFAYKEYHYLGESDLNFRYGLNFHNEFLMGNTGFFTAYGFYIRDSEYYTRRGYYKVGFKFYWKNVIGVALIRAMPLFRADVVEVGIGYRLKSMKKGNSNK